MPKWTPEQEDAIYKNGSNIIVSAGAGSGKTAVLSERVLNKLQKNIHVNELLILTFTRAAADEMKSRIRKKINEDESLKSEIAYLDSAYITTFDSYALSVLKKYHYLMNISNDIKISDEFVVEIEQRKIFDKCFLKMYKSNDDKFFKLLDKFCLKNDSILRNNIYEIAKSIDNFIDRDEYLKLLKDDFYNDKLFDRLIKELTDIVDIKKSVVKLELDNLSYYFDSDYIEKVKVVVNPLLSVSNLEDLGLYLKITLPSVPRGSFDDAKEAKSRLKKAIDEYLCFGKYSSVDNLKKQFYLNKDITLTIIDILCDFYEELDNYKSKNNIYTFSDVAKLSIKLLEENVNVRNEIRDSFKEIMIDEYQDTNDIQEQFISLISNNNVYMVGDIKQSIYRFRGSNPGIFKAKYDNYSNDNGGIKIDLIKNFRSRCEVLKNVNNLFDLLMDSDIGGANYKESHEMIYGNVDYDENKLEDFNYDFDILEYDLDGRNDFSKNEVEIFTIANDIKKKMSGGIKVYDKDNHCLRNAKYSDFVIILDRSKYFENYKRIFEYLNIPLEILRDGKLNENSDLLLIRNIIDFIISINNKCYDVNFKYDFMSIGRSFLYEYSDEYLFDVITNNKFFETKLYKDFSNISNYNSKTGFELFMEILDITGFYYKIFKVGNYENLNVRLETISSLINNMNENGKSFEDLKSYLDEIIEQNIDIKYTMFSAGSDSVKILTIHKSKGLEYPFCYFADLDHDFNLVDLKNNFIVTRDYGIITPLLDLDDDSNFVKEIYKNKYISDEISEKIRLFYVALTRAREKITIVLPYKDTIQYEKNIDGVLEKIRRLNFKKLSDFIYATKYYLKDYFIMVDLESIGLTKEYLYNKPLNSISLNNNVDKLVVNNLNVVTNNLSSEHFSKNQLSLKTREEQKNMEFGTYIHEILEYCDLKNPNLDYITDDYIKNKIISFINNLLILNSNGTFYHEYEFIYNDNDKKMHGIIDLLIEEENKIIIVDFKLKNILDDAYKKQLDGYKNYVHTLTNKPIETYLYSILEDKFIKI